MARTWNNNELTSEWGEATRSQMRSLESDLLVAWAQSEAYMLTSAVRDANEVVSSATVMWPDRTAGVLTVTATDPVTGAINAYTLTHPANNQTVTQAAMTRDSSGAVTAQPTLTVT